MTSKLDPTPQTGFEQRYITVGDGLRLAFRDYGSAQAPGPTILCLGGLSRNSRDFHDLALWLKPNHRVICPDYIGRGDSDRAEDAERYQPPRMLGDVLALTTALNLHNLIVVGTSLGGFLTMGLAVLSPTLVRAAVINDAGPDFGNTALERIVDYLGQDHPKPDWETAIHDLKTQFAHLGFEEDQDWRDLAEGSFTAGDDGLLHVSWDTRLVETITNREDGFDLWALFKALGDREVLALRGANSDALLPETFKEMAENLPNITAITVDNRAHTPSLREPIVRENIAAFLERVDHRLMDNEQQNMETPATSASQSAHGT
ncbi:MAG: alpha/beta hydrolase [Alphaproteobacteria bacterium]|nr:alpha/beta hydrolase [Alphaproteobacteria bacterium SS10]